MAGEVFQDRAGDENRAIEVAMEGGLSFRFLGLEARPGTDVTHFRQPHPRDHLLGPLISIRFRFFDLINPDDETCDLICSRDLILQTHQLSKAIKAFFYMYLSHGLPLCDADTCIQRFCSSIHENPPQNSNSTRYFSISICRKGWRQSPYFVPKREVAEEYVSMDGEWCVTVLKSRPGQQRFYVSSNSTSECSVCLEQLEKGEVATRLPCSHSFHNYCIVRWLLTSRSCPLCRFPIPTAYS